MQLIDELIEMLSSSNSSLEDALLKTKVLLYKLGEPSLTKWVDSELNGYNPGDEIPDYRIVTSRVLVNATNGYFARWNDYPAPLMHLDEGLRNLLTRTTLGQSISGIEHLAKSNAEVVSKHLPTEMCSLISKGLAQGVFAESGHIEISKAGLLQITTQVRSRLLTFVLELSSRIPSNIPEASVKGKAKEINTQSLFHNAVFGGNTTIIVGDGNTQNVAISIVKNDFEALSRLLREKGIGEPDIESLKVAIENDESAPDHAHHKFGSGVREWMSKMLSKAVDTSWQIELGAAGSLLSSALMHYYGWFGAN
jgi:hypothetical protein